MKPFLSHRPTGVRSHRAGGMRRRLLFGLALLVCLIALLPWIVAKTPLRDMVLSAAMPSDQLQFTTQSASLGWFSAPELSNVEVKDRASGQTLLAIESLRMDRPPLALMSNPRDLGAIDVTRPTVYLALRPDGSNIEDAIQELVANLTEDSANDSADEARPTPMAASLRLTDGTILIDDLASRRRWRAEKINLQFKSTDVGKSFEQLSLSSQLVEIAAAEKGASAHATPAGQVALSLSAVDGRRQLSWQVDALVVAVVRPWLRRYVVGADLSGTLAGAGNAAWTPLAGNFPTDFVSSGAMRVEQLDVAAPILAGDRLQLARVEMPWQVSSQPIGLVINDLQITSELGQLAVRGVLDPKSLPPVANVNFNSLDAIASHDVEVRGSLDLARIAALLPHALRVRDSTKITAGAIEFAARQQPAPGGQLVTGSLRATNVTATNAGRPISWDEPVSAEFAVERVHGATRINTLNCESEFLTARASGTPDEFSASAKFDLTRLATQLGQFVDLSATELAGTGTAKLNWRRTDGQQFSASANGDLSQFRMMLAGGKVWAEPQLGVRAELAGTTDPVTRRLARIDSGRVELDGQGDLLDAQLTSPIDMSFGTPTWPVAVRVSGSIARWLTRARPWYSADPWQIDGQGELAANVRVASRAAEFRDVKLLIKDLRATSPDWNINEPRLELSGDAQWDGVTGEFAANAAQFVTSTVAIALQNVRFQPGQAGTSAPMSQLNGMAAFRADLARLATWRATPNQPRQYRPQGSLEGKMTFAQQADGVRGELTAAGENLSLAQLSTASRAVSGPEPPNGYKTIWQEPRLNIRGLVSYQAATDRLAFNDCQIQSNTLQAAAGGQIERLSTTGDVNVSGTLNYDLAQITLLLKPYMGEGIQLTGREKARFALAGQLFDGNGRPAHVSAGVSNDPYRVVNDSSASLGAASTSSPWSRRMRGTLEAPWAGANVYGLPVGGGKVSATLGDGMLRVEPLSLAVGEGRLTASPTVRLDPEPAELTLPQGPLVTNVRISPEVSEAMLKYVAPVLAGATQSEGLFSMQIDGARIPLGDTNRMAAQGTLSVHSVQVTPGPLAQQWVGLAQQIEALAKNRDAAALAQRPQMTLLAIRDQAVNFRVVNGRVHHDQMEFVVDDVVMRSQGSVGFDETLALTVQVPIQDRWIENQKLLVGLKGQTLSIPIGGTLSRPQMDSRAVASLSQQLLQSAAQQAIGGELNKALEKLFKSK